MNSSLQKHERTTHCYGGCQYVSSCALVEQLGKSSSDRRTASLLYEFWCDGLFCYVKLYVDISDSRIWSAPPPLDGECENWNTRWTPKAADKEDSRPLFQLPHLHDKWRKRIFKIFLSINLWTCVPQAFPLVTWAARAGWDCVNWVRLCERTPTRIRSPPQSGCYNQTLSQKSSTKWTFPLMMIACAELVYITANLHYSLHNCDCDINNIYRDTLCEQGFKYVSST